MGITAILGFGRGDVAYSIQLRKIAFYRRLLHMRGSLLYDLFCVLQPPTNMHDNCIKSTCEKDATAAVSESKSSAMH